MTPEMLDNRIALVAQTLIDCNKTKGEIQKEFGISWKVMSDMAQSPEIQHVFFLMGLNAGQKMHELIIRLLGRLSGELDNLSTKDAALVAVKLAQTATMLVTQPVPQSVTQKINIDLKDADAVNLQIQTILQGAGLASSVGLRLAPEVKALVERIEDEQEDDVDAAG